MFVGKWELEANVFAVYLMLGDGFREAPLLVEALVSATNSGTTKFLAHLVRDRTGEYS